MMGTNERDGSTRDHDKQEALALSIAFMCRNRCAQRLEEIAYREVAKSQSSTDKSSENCLTNTRDRQCARASLV
jgi:hypothetical protein